MKKEKIAVWVLAAGVVVLGYWWYTLVWQSFTANTEENVRIHFLNVGQGDAILIETKNKKQILIDAGRDMQILRALEKIIPVHDKDIDVAVMTHPDADHIGGFAAVLKKYTINTIMQSFIPSKTSIYKKIQEEIKKEEEKGAKKYTISEAYMFTIDGVDFTVMWPIGNRVREKNAASIILLVAYGEVEILLTGDAPSAVEEEIIQLFEKELEDIEILKAGHHGSKTSTGEKLLLHTKPNALIYSAGKNNAYGHPHDIVKERVNVYKEKHPKEHIKSYKTTDGTISFCMTKKQFSLCH